MTSDDYKLLSFDDLFPIRSTLHAAQKKNLIPLLLPDQPTAMYAKTDGILLAVLMIVRKQ